MAKAVIRVCAAICAVFVLCSSCEKRESSGLLRIESFDSRFFFEGVLSAEKTHAVIDFRVRGGIVPHHLTAGFMIADFFKTIQRQNTDTFIIIGPNHYETGAPVITTGHSWKTEFGIINADTVFVNQLVSSGLAVEDPAVMTGEHSITSIIPYISYYFPQAKVVPIIFKHGADYRKISDFLSHSSGESCVIIASVDFSHYLSSREAQEKDMETKRILSHYDLEAVQSHGRNNDYFDSPASLCTLLSVMKNRTSCNQKILGNTNSGILAARNDIEVTSYFSIVFY